jgi:hypothetical protein
MRITHVTGSHGWSFTDFWWEHGYCRFYGIQPLTKCLEMAKGKFPWPSLPPDPRGMK